MSAIGNQRKSAHMVDPTSAAIMVMTVARARTVVTVLMVGTGIKPERSAGKEGGVISVTSQRQPLLRLLKNIMKTLRQPTNMKKSIMKSSLALDSDSNKSWALRKARIKCD